MDHQETVVDWNGQLRTKGGKLGLLLPPAPLEKRRRVAISRDGLAPTTDVSEWSRPGKEVTVWLYRESGVIRCDGQPCDMDLVAA